MIVGVWFPADDTYVTLKTREISATSSSHHLEGLIWSDATQQFYITAQNGIYTLAKAAMLTRPRTKLTPQAK